MSVRTALRLVIVSDTHRSYRRPIPPGDVFIHAGDSELSAGEMDTWLARLPHRHKIVVGGNMDYRLREGAGDLQQASYLQDGAITVDGVKIYGSPWTPKFVGVFQLDDAAAAGDVWACVPDDVDVLVTHGPPKGVLDRTSRGRGVGDGTLMCRVDELRPRVHCFGHVHESYGALEKDGTLFCNAAVFNGHAALVVDVPLDRKLPAMLVR